MTSVRCRLGPRFGFALPLLAVAALLVSAPAAWAASPAADQAFAAYRYHLAQLDEVLSTCQKQRTTQACDENLVGANDKVPWPAGSSVRREIRYDWLRALLVRAGKKEEKRHDANRGPALAIKAEGPTLDDQFAEAHQRMAADGKQADEQAGAPAAGDYSAQRKSLAAILARREFQGMAQPTSRDRFVEWLDNWIDRIFGGLEGFGARSPWIGRVLLALLVLVICVGLVWMLVRIERRARIHLIPDLPSRPGKPSSRQWQLWFKDAQAMAAQGLWREAIHFLYWAAISRLEARQMWPANRACTPREYLRLVPGADPRRPGLATLTRSFERTWYGGYDAGAEDYQAAARTAAELGVE